MRGNYTETRGPESMKKRRREVRLRQSRKEGIVCVCVGRWERGEGSCSPSVFLKFQLLFGNKTELEVIAERQRERM